MLQNGKETARKDFDLVDTSKEVPLWNYLWDALDVVWRPANAFSS